MPTVGFLRRGVLACALISAAAVPVASGTAVAGTADAHTLTRIAKAQWSPDAAVRAIAVSRTRVFIAGDFTHLRNTATGHRVKRVRVAAFRRDTGALVRGFKPRVNGSVFALTVFGHKLVIGGDFTSVSGQDRQHFAAVSGRSGHVSNWVVPVDGRVFALLSMRGRVYVGGDFLHVDGVLRSHLLAVDGDGVLVPTWPSQGGGTDRGVYTLAASADRRSVVVGGSFHQLVGSPRTYLGEVARVSGQVRAWNPAPACTGQCFVKSLAVNKHLVFAGIAGPGGNVAAYFGDSAVTKWSRHTNGDVTALALAGKHLIIGGHFTLVNRHRHRMFAQLVARKGKVTKRRLATSGQAFPGILALDVHDGRIRIGGGFDGIAGQRRYAIVPE
jgi:hypothetical protein